MQNNFTYLASAPIQQYDLLTIDPANSAALSIAAKPAGSGDSILGRADQDCPIGEPITFTTLTIGQTVTCVAGADIVAGNHLSAVSGKVVPGSAALIAVDSVSTGQKLRVVVTAELNDGVPVAKGAQTIVKADGSPLSVGGYDRYIFVGTDGVPRTSPGSYGDVNTPIYIDSGRFKVCENIGGSTGEFCHLDELSTRDAVKSFVLGSTTGQQVKGYAIYNANNDHFSIQWSLPEGQTQPMLVVGVLHNFYNTSDPTKKLPDIPIIIKVAQQITWDLDPSYYGGQMGNRATFDCIILKA